MPFTSALATVLAFAPAALPQVPVQPVAVVSSFCDNSFDRTSDASNKTIGQPFNYTLCMDVAQKATSMICYQGQPCPGGPNVATQLYTGGMVYIVDHTGKCTKKPCQTCDPPNALPFSFLLIDDDSRGVATRVGSTTIDGVAVDHWSHKRTPTEAMNWYLRNLSTAPNEPKQLVRTTFAHAGQGSGSRDFSRKWVSPAPKSSFVIPKACATASADAREPPAETPLFAASVGSEYGDHY